MAAGKLGISSPIPSTNTVVYTVLAPINVATFNINVVNTSKEVIKVRLAIAASINPAASEWIEYDVAIDPSGVLERTSMAASVGESVIVRASAAGIAVRVYGFEQ